MHIKSALATYLFTCLLFQIHAQNKTSTPLLQEKRKAIEHIQQTFSGKPESFNALIDEGKEGLDLTAQDDFANLYLFNQAIASGYYYKQRFDSASIHFETSYLAAKQGGLLELSTKPLGNLISIYHYMGLQPKADSAYQQLRSLTETVDTLKNKGDIYYNLGLYNQQQKSYYTIALDYFLQSAELHRSKVDTTSIPKIKTDYAVKLMMVAEIYLQLKQPEKALEYLNTALPYLGTSIPVDITTYGKFVRSYVLLGDRKRAKAQYDVLHQTIGKAPGAWSEAISSNLEMANLAIQENDYPSAKGYLDKAEALANRDKKEIMLYSVHLNYGDYHMALENYTAALRYYEMAHPVSGKYSKEQRAALLKSMAAANIAIDNTGLALTYFNDYIRISDSLTAQKVSANLSEMEAVYQNKSKQQQIENQNIEIALANKQLVWLIGGLSSLALSILLLYLIYRNNREAAKVLDAHNKTLTALNYELDEANRAKAMLFGIISHDLRSPINQVYQFLKLQQLNPHALTPQQKEEQGHKIQHATFSLLETMEDLLLWSKTQMDAFKTEIQSVEVDSLLTTCLNLLHLNADAKNIVYEQQIPPALCIRTDPNYLQTILRNLLLNAIKASPEQGKILITADTHSISISNQGIPFSQQQYETLLRDPQTGKGLTGLGLKLADELSKKINATLHFNATLEGVNSVTVKFG